MVKRLIAGLLKKKGSAASQQDQAGDMPEDVPDELPPLAEDMAADEPADEPASMATASKAASKEQAGEEPPDDLPSLDIGEESEKGEEKSGDADSAEMQKDSISAAKEEDLPEEIKKAKAAKTKGIDASNAGMEDAKPEAIEPMRSRQMPATSADAPELGFFSSVRDHVKKNEGYRDKLLSGDLFSRMSNYWELKKEEVRTGAVTTQKKLESDIVKKLEELKMLEQKWQIQKMALEEDLKFLHEREREIQAKAEELKRISNELSLFKEMAPGQYFHLSNGVVLKSLHDLVDVLEIIDDETFRHHVTVHKNDFAEWVQETLKDHGLASRLRAVNTKGEMIETLEKEPLLMHAMSSSYKEKIPPRKYFWLENGVLIKSLNDLADALKNMDGDLFDRHVTDEKNDFANWIRNSLGNDSLASKVEKARKKDEMAHIVQVFA